MILTIILIFLSTFLIDILWVFYIKSVNKNKALMTANISTLMYILSVFVIISYVGDLIFAIPAIAGSWIGNFTAIKFSIYLKQKNR